MDPDQTYSDFLDSVRHGQIDDAIDHASNLQGWMTHGGFTPRHFKAGSFNAFCHDNDVEC